MSTITPDQVQPIPDKISSKDYYSEVKEKFPEAGIYEGHGGLAHPIVVGDTLLGYVVPIHERNTYGNGNTQPFFNNVVIHLDWENHSGMDLSKVGDSLTNIISADFGSSIKPDAVIIDLAPADEFIDQEIINQDSIVEGLGFAPTKDSSLNILLTHWDRSPSGVAVLRLNFYGKNLPNPHALAQVYDGVRYKYGLMKENGNTPGKVYDVIQISKADIPFIQIVTAAYGLAKVLNSHMPPQEFAGAMVILKANDQPADYIRSSLSYLLSRAYMGELAENISKAYEIIDKLYQKSNK